MSITIVENNYQTSLTSKSVLLFVVFGFFGGAVVVIFSFFGGAIVVFLCDADAIVVEFERVVDLYTLVVGFDLTNFVVDNASSCCCFTLAACEIVARTGGFATFVRRVVIDFDGAYVVDYFHRVYLRCSTVL